jgi:putative transcriptional regulator
MNKTEFQLKFGRHIAMLRKEKNLSQVALADILDKEKQNINRIENGGTNPTAWLIYQLAEALETTPQRLFDFL